MPKAVLEQNEAFTRTSGENALSMPQALRANASALPVKGAMARTMLAADKDAEKQAEFVRRTRERLLRQADRLDHQADRMAGTIKPSYIKMSKKDEIGLNRYNAEKIREEAAKLDPEAPEPKKGTIPESEARRILIEDAMKRGDQKALMEIPMEDHDTFLKRWMDHIEHHSSVPGELSPAEVREKLLKDAKKRSDQEAIRAIPNENYDQLRVRWTEYLSRVESNSRSPGGGPSTASRKALREKRRKKR